MRDGTSGCSHACCCFFRPRPRDVEAPAPPLRRERDLRLRGFSLPYGELALWLTPRCAWWPREESNSEGNPALSAMRSHSSREHDMLCAMGDFSSLASK